MKIIALLPVKNEAWILPTCLSSLKLVVDEIIALDDHSTDQSCEILKQFGAIVAKLNQTSNEFVPMSERRQYLLELGRQRGGTHFVWLDADEAFTAPLIQSGKELISKLKPGEKIILPWLALWKSTNYYRQDGIWGKSCKDFIVCDHLDYNFNKTKILSEPRTPGPFNKNSTQTLTISQGAVLHFQFVYWEKFQMKQAWYRCLELIKRPGKAFFINKIYVDTLDDNPQLTALPTIWTQNIIMPANSSNIFDWHREEIFKWFDEYGIEFFEPLQIWHIPELKKIFVLKMNRLPRPEIKNLIKSSLYYSKKLLIKLRDVFKSFI